MFKMWLLTNDDKRRPIGEPDSFEEATKIIKDLDEEHVAWEAAGKPKHPFPPVLDDWDGCDVYLEDEQGKTYMITAFGWQDYNEFRQREDAK